MTAPETNSARGARACRTWLARGGDGQLCPALAALTDPRVRLGLGAIGMLVSAAPVHPDRVGQRETRAFRAVNGLPDWLYIPAWMIMQLGSFGSVPAAAGAAWMSGDRRLAWRLAAGGSATWALAKLVKRKVRRPRPAGLLTDARRRGPEPSGLGYLSGHAGVASALGTAALPRCGPRGRAVISGIVPLIGLSRAYVGAHLPLDIVGGAALGIAVDAAVALAQQAADARMTAQPPDGRHPAAGVRSSCGPAAHDVGRHAQDAGRAAGGADNGASKGAMAGRGRDAG